MNEKRFTLAELVELFTQQLAGALGEDGIMIVVAARTKTALEIRCAFNNSVSKEAVSEAGSIVERKLSDVAREYTDGLPGVKSIPGSIVLGH